MQDGAVMQRITADPTFVDAMQARIGELEDRLDFAERLLAQSPHYLFLDEPTSGVDPLARRAFSGRSEMNIAFTIRT